MPLESNSNSGGYNMGACIRWKDSIYAGVMGGILWGWMILLLNNLTHAFHTEQGIFYNIFIFPAGGALLGALVAIMTELFYELIPFPGLTYKIVFVSVAIWTLLRIGGSILSLIKPERYHQSMPATIQGFVFAILMGLLIGFFMARKMKSQAG